MNEKKGTECIRVAVTVPVRDTFSYLVPEQLSPGIRVGCRVLVPFKKRKVTGYVLERIEENDDIELKAVLDVLDSEPLFPQKMVPFFEWLADYYFHPIGQVIQTSLPGGLNAVNYKSASLTKTGLKILEQLSQQTEQRDILSWIKDHPGKKIPWPVGKLYPLRKKGWLIIEERARRQTAGPLIRKFVRPKQDIELESILREKAHLVRAKNEEEFLKAIFDLGIVLLSDLNVKFTNAYYLVKKWTKENVIEQYEGSLYRDPAGATIFPAPTPPRLYGQQKAAVKKINECLDRKAFSPCLLYGVTGSGKTEVYFRAVEHAIRLGKKAILMVPEIALVTYLESIFRARLGNRIAVYHSRLSHGERYDQWIRMARGEVDMVIGARSALFAPFSELGIIIVDEEHDASYKQDTSPGYQARDAAVMRAKMENAVVLLGSGTQSVQSFQNSISKKYDLILMPDRVEQRPLPDVQIVDMKKLDKKTYKTIY
jgi:primosomal protein N' (replication factor Y)